MTITGLFDDPAVALRTGEKVRELVGSRATVRVFVPGPEGRVVETKVVVDKSSYRRVPLIGLGLGLAFAVIAKLAGLSWGLTLLGFATGILVGPMLAVWLTGEAYWRGVCERQVRDTRRSAVSATVEDRDGAERVRALLVDRGAQLA